jgi:hypothetical protein
MKGSDSAGAASFGIVPLALSSPSQATLDSAITAARANGRSLFEDATR